MNRRQFIAGALAAPVAGKLGAPASGVDTSGIRAALANPYLTAWYRQHLESLLVALSR